MDGRTNGRTERRTHHCCISLSAPSASMFPPSSAPLLLPQLEELVVPLHTAFTLTCQGEAAISWDPPLDVPEKTQEDNSGLFVTTITVDSATAMHTGYYTCFYRRNATEDADEALQSSIYVYVPGTAAAACSRRLTSAHWDFCPLRFRPRRPLRSVGGAFRQPRPVRPRGDGDPVPGVGSRRQRHADKCRHPAARALPVRQQEGRSGRVHGWDVRLPGRRQRSGALQRGIHRPRLDRCVCVVALLSGLHAIKAVAFWGRTADVISTNCCFSGSSGLHVELTAKHTVLLVGDTITVNCLARGSEILEDHWKYPGKVVRTRAVSRGTVQTGGAVQLLIFLPFSRRIVLIRRFTRTKRIRRFFTP